METDLYEKEEDKVVFHTSFVFYCMLSMWCRCLFLRTLDIKLKKGSESSRVFIFLIVCHAPLFFLPPVGYVLVFLGFVLVRLLHINYNFHLLNLHQNICILFWKKPYKYLHDPFQVTSLKMTRHQKRKIDETHVEVLLRQKRLFAI